MPAFGALTETELPTKLPVAVWEDYEPARLAILRQMLWKEQLITTDDRDRIQNTGAVSGSPSETFLCFPAGSTVIKLKAKREGENDTQDIYWIIDVS